MHRSYGDEEHGRQCGWNGVTGRVRRRCWRDDGKVHTGPCGLWLRTLACTWSEVQQADARVEEGPDVIGARSLWLHVGSRLWRERRSRENREEAAAIVQVGEDEG